MRNPERYLVAIAVAGALLAGCASTPRTSPELTRAQDAVEQLSGQPLAMQAAGPDLDAARGEVHRAQNALSSGAPMDTVDHYAYLALRAAQAGEARVDAAQAQSQVAHATEERQRLLLAAQKRQAMVAQQQVQSAQQQVQAAQNEAQQARGQAQAAQQQLKQMQTEQLGARQTDQGMVLTLGNVLFSTGKATLQPGASLQLDRLAGYLKDHPKQRVLIEGNTDNTGSADLNQRLSGLRAQAVAQALQLRGVQENQYQTMGLGESYPVAGNDTSAGRQQNRRVDVVFSNASGQFSEAALSRQGATER